MKKRIYTKYKTDLNKKRKLFQQKLKDCPINNNDIVQVAQEGINAIPIITPRTQMKLILRDACSSYIGWNILTNEQQDTIIRRIERSCMNKIVLECKKEFIDRYWGINYNRTSYNQNKFLERYNTEIYRQIYHILNPDSYYIKKICNGDFDLNKVSSLSNIEMSPISYEQEQTELQIRRKQKIIEKFTDKYPCKKCGGTKVLFHETAGRSLGADEISRFQYTCYVCHYNWVR